MADARIEHVFDCTQETFWGKVFFSEEYNRRLFLDTLGFSTWRVVRLEEGPDRVERVVDCAPPLGDLPGPLKKLAEGGAGYREIDSYDRKTHRMTLRVEPSVLRDKLTITGVSRTEPAGPGKCRRIYDSTVVAKVFGLGGMIEGRILDDVRKSYDQAAVFTNRYLAEKGLAGT